MPELQPLKGNAAVAIAQRQFKTYILQDPNHLARLEVVPERGGIITSWCVGDRELLYLDAERFANPSLSIRGGIPILFPICGNMPDDAYTHSDRIYTLKQHGFARDLAWQVDENSLNASEDSTSITLTLSSNPQTLVGYPFDFDLAFTYTLQSNTLTIHQRYTNRSAESMPFSSGLHPYFLATDKSKLSFHLPATQYWDHVSHSTQTYAGGFDFSQDQIDLGFRPLSGSSAQIFDTGNQSLMLSFDQHYTTLVFWAIKGKDYVCLEPWTAPRNAMNTGEDLIYVAPNTSLEMQVQFAASLTLEA
ncbi:aldose epimerase [Tumidithrix elongata RA019]|uniref:Aldose epimerase n=1 Tax=Tumidithrix elongata BACA0141 TaxID=2716417 RepID=A0AAW9Q3R5_9CYAN|nr:aldose epimerase [Tumidithrix elongata RA019]